MYVATCESETFIAFLVSAAAKKAFLVLTKRCRKTEPEVDFLLCVCVFFTLSCVLSCQSIIFLSSGAQYYLSRGTHLQLVW